ncbi:hypothetical protein MRB53_009198 [Persea americana]|uniref:Uncharacterized protein n=1 Tax=Persea americana TaxID=3435 RepID=A0ACC2LN91_PERAE|nr:hypothetical protein MRB53_009198 [Persea americana]
MGTFFPDLDELRMSRNSFQGSIPPSIGDMRSLGTLDLSHNNLSGEVPDHLFDNCASLQVLMLSNNSLQGKIFSISSNLTGLMYLYLDNNHFMGKIPASLFNASLLGLDIGDNQISGKIPSPLGYLSRLFGYIPSLSTLILRGNHLDGMIPHEFCKLKELRFLDLSDNHLSGPIPSCFNLTNLQHMHLEKNAFSGLIPKALSGCLSIISLNIRYNNMVGVIPVWIGGLSKLRLLLLRGNNLHGRIPIELCQLKNLSSLDLSYNNLFGSLPSCINNLTFGRSTILDNAFLVRGKEAVDEGHPDGLYPYVDYEVTDELTRVEFITKHILNSYNGGLLKFMSGIDFSCNQLAGEIPLELGQLSGLHSLNLSYNQLSGPIPTTFNNLSQIESLDLSFNRLNGTIPSELIELYYLAVFSVAHNNLSGSTPDMKFQFATFNESSYVGNPLLCGLPLNKSCISTTPTIRAPKEDEDDDDNGLVYFYASFIGSYSVFLLGTIAVLYFTSQRRAVCFLYIVDSWCAFRLYKLYRLFSWKLSDLNIISMECPQVLCFWVLVFGFQLLLCGGFGCFEKEKSALLELKLSINHPNGTSFPSWGGGTDCCTWDGVTCNSRTARVIELDLSGSMDTDLGDWYLNASLLLPLEKLQSLVLNFNSLTGFIDGEAIETLTSLRTIDFAWNGFNDPQSIQGFCKLKGLQRLDLSYNYFKGPIPLCLGNLKSLQLLNLSNNGFSGMLPTSTNGNDESQGPLPIKGLCKFKDIKWLDLSFNHFEGSIPSCLGNFSNLQLLDLSNNGFSGKIPASTFSNVTSLSYLSLAKNNFSGIVEFRSFAHLSKLKEFVLSYNDLEVETEYLMLNSTFQLTVLGLSNCKLNKDTGSSIPNFLYNQRELMVVDLSHNHLLGNFPNWLFEKNQKLEVLNLMNNSLWGTILLPLHCNHTSLLFLEVSNNHISGQIPSHIGSLLPKLRLLNMSRNSFHGSIPPSIGNMRVLATLDLSYNTLSGEIPEDLAAGCVSLSTLKLSNNSFHGKIFSTYLNMSNLYFLYLDNNHFVGTIPPSLFNVSMLWRLDIGDNHLSGRIPRQIGGISRFSTVLILRGNHLNGLVPSEICKLRYLQFLDLSDNCLSGPIPSCSNFTELKFMHLENNSFSGFIPRALSSSSSMISLNIRHNYIDGVIPVWIGRLSRLRILLLKGNNLHGHIPNELCQLKNLCLLDLSYNNLFGSLPTCLNNLTFGRSIFLDEFSSGGTYLYLTRSLNVYALDIIISEATNGLRAVGFITKRMENYYKGGILNYMSGIDVSCNQLTGEIPREMGQLSGLHSMNLSYNQFAGPIPATFKNLSQIESLDLSHNKLNGTIPPELVDLNYLAVFSVAHNNLSGRIPDMKSQFSTFTECSYEGNPLLCGPPLSRSCISTAPISEAPEEDEIEDDDDIVSFYCSFAGSYLVFLMGTIGVLYFISQRRAICFLYVVDSWCAFHLYKLYGLFSCNLIPWARGHEASVSSLQTIFLGALERVKEVDWHQLDAIQKISGAINRRSLQQSKAHITEGEDEEDNDEAAEGEQDSVSDCLTRLKNEVHALSDNINYLNANITARFTFVDESLAAILAHLGHQ